VVNDREGEIRGKLTIGEGVEYNTSRRLIILRGKVPKLFQYLEDTGELSLLCEPNKHPGQDRGII
jgi:hypothetical protein